ncbi:hypothetical protein ONZ51_g5244 [Trametes cubensis]|uniref:Uncharacterized protein n=1 Tax=Trametes cubensis TaxID=1111947 RepID=A0AAD7TWT1_9APHY|nr:hypothetical protein ONZ51_g5244 [Trametes cubensis]
MSTPTTLSALPTELLYIIAQVSTATDFLSLLLANRNINGALTPLLYGSIILKCYAVAQKCTDTLSNDPTANFDGRDLAACVWSFTVDFQHYGMFGEWRVRFRNSLEIALGRMSGLQHFTFYSAYFGTPRTFISALRAAASTLRTLGFRPDENVWWEDETDAHVFDEFRLEFPELNSIALTLFDDLAQPWYAFFQYLLASRSKYLRTLSITDYWERLTLAPLLRTTTAWSALEELTLVILNSNFSVADLPPAPNVRKLTIDTLFKVPGKARVRAPIPDSIPGHLFPNLEHLACPYQLLPAFLPPDVETQRPIKIVCLDPPYFDPNRRVKWATSRFTDWPLPQWADVRNALTCLPRSAGPVVDLSFCVDGLDAATLGNDLSWTARSLERLFIALHQDPDNADHLGHLGETLFAYTPKLSTFVLSDVPKEASFEWTFVFASDREQQNNWLEEWERNAESGTLREVAFTAECRWRRMEHGWVVHDYKEEE